MKNIIKIALAFVTALAMLLCSCADNTVTEPDVTTEADGTAAPELTPSKHEITVSEVESILAENGLRTNIDSFLGDSAAYHGGQQMRVCHTERGTYSAFVCDPGDENNDDIQKFYVSKTDNDGVASILFYGEFPSDNATITVNIGQDINGNILVTAISPEVHNMYIFDFESDEVTEYKVATNFASGESPGYSQTMFDFENRKVYVFHNGIFGSGKYLLEWFVFDIEAGKWSDTSVYTWIEDTYRHVYLHPFADGKGGAYIVGIRGDSQFAKEGKPEPVLSRYAWDQLDLFYIPNLSNADNITYTTIHEVYDDRVDEGIWSNFNTQSLDVYVDLDGYMHVTYQCYKVDVAGNTPDLDIDRQYRHAIYSGLDCIYNEKIDTPEADYPYYKPMIRQSTDGTLHLIIAKLEDKTIQLDLYKALDDLGKEWNHEKHIDFGEGITTSSLTISAVRDGSVQDNILSGFFYGYCGTNKTAYNFTLSLEDYSITSPVNILDGFDIQIDWWYDERIPASEHQPSIVSTENGVYAAFVYNYNHEESKEDFHIVKIDDDGVAVLYSDSFGSKQDKYLTMTDTPDGKIYVCPPTGDTAYVIDTAADTVTPEKRTQIIVDVNLEPEQSNIIFDGEKGAGYYVYTIPGESFDFINIPADSDKSVILAKTAEKYAYSTQITDAYTNIYALSNNNGGTYLVGTRKIELENKLEYNGYLKTADDSIMLFYIPDISEIGEIKCTEVCPPHESEGQDGIWSVAKVKDVYLDSDGKLNILYAYYHFDFDDGDRKNNPELITSTLKHCIAVYDGVEQVSLTELDLGLSQNDSVRFAETADGTVYLVSCNLQRDTSRLGYDDKYMRYGIYPEGGEAKISVYGETDDGFALVSEKVLGDFAAEGFFVSNSAQGDCVDCLVYASDNDVYYVNIDFEIKE